MGNLEPWGDAADAGAVDLDDGARAAREILPEMRRVIERFAHRDGDGRVGRELDVAGKILGRQRLLEPRKPERLECPRAPDGFGHAEALIRIDHDLELPAHRFAYCREPRDVFGDVRLAYLELRAAKTLRLSFQRLRDERLRRQVQPPAFGRVDG